MRRLAMRCEAAKPNRFITLTVNPRLYVNPREAYDKIRRLVPELAKRIRRSVGGFEYMKVLEETKAGWPHYHLLATSPFIKQDWLSKQWAELSGAPIVDIRNPKQIRSTYAYVVKYLGKQTAVTWTNRRISWTKRFFPPEPKAPNEGWKLHVKRRLLAHPAAVVEYALQGETLVPLTPTAWAIKDGGGIEAIQEISELCRRHFKRK